MGTKLLHYPIFLFLMISCEPGDTFKAKRPSFFDIRGFFDEQVLMLDSLNPILRKIAFLNDKADTSIFRPDSAGWAREFEIFTEMDLNRPVLLDKYAVSREYDSIADVERIRHELREGEETGTQYLDIIRKNEKVVRIEGIFREKSMLYEAERKHSVHLDQMQGILHYSVLGWQKIVLQDTVYYRVEAEILY